MIENDTQIKVQVNEDQTCTLRCAYETLLSMKVKERKLTGYNFIDVNILFATVVGTSKPVATGYSWRFFAR